MSNYYIKEMILKMFYDEESQKKIQLSCKIEPNIMTKLDELTQYYKDHGQGFRVFKADVLSRIIHEHHYHKIGRFKEDVRKIAQNK